MDNLDLDLTYNGAELPRDITIQLIRYALDNLNVPPSYLITKLHYEGLWGDSNTAQLNNNWGGMTWNSSWSDPYKRPSGVTITRGSARPAIEGGYYIKYDTVHDFLIDWSYLIRKGGIYNVANSSSFDNAVKGMFVYGGAQADYATMNVTGSKRRYELYLVGMKARRTAINNANNGILDTLDNGEFDDGHTEDDPPKDTGNEDFEVIVNKINNIITTIRDEFKQFEEDFYEAIMNMSNTDLYEYGQSNFIGNKFYKVTKTLKNIYKLKASTGMEEVLDDLIENINSQLDDIQEELNNIETDSDESIPKPDPIPKGDKFFPVDYNASGINFWHPPYSTNLPRNMDYGFRTSGIFHAGYDVGGGGVSTHGIYAVTDGVITHVENRTGAGFVIAIEHTSDEYHSLYMHLVQDSNFVNVGDTVVGGQRIATMGATGGNYAIHLHFELSPTGEFHGEQGTIDPKPYLQVIGDNNTTLKNPVS